MLAQAPPGYGVDLAQPAMELSGNNNRLDWRRIVAIAQGSRRYLGLPTTAADAWFNRS